MTSPPGGVPTDTCTHCNSISWNPTTRVLSLSGNATLTLTGDNYLFCRLDLGPRGRAPSGGHAVEHPEGLHGRAGELPGESSGAGGVSLTGRVTNLNTNPATFALLVAGSGTSGDGGGPVRRRDHRNRRADGDLRAQLHGRLQEQPRLQRLARGEDAEGQEQRRHRVRHADRQHHQRQLDPPLRLRERQLPGVAPASPPAASPDAGC